MTVLLGFAALVVDIGLNWATRTSAQTAADSAALAGASVLAGGRAGGGHPRGAVAAGRQHRWCDRGGRLGTDGIEANGEVDCWTLPDPPPTSEPCLDGSNALQVITPPIEVQYAFAPVLGEGLEQHQGAGRGRGRAGGAQQLRALPARPGRGRPAGGPRLGLDRGGRGWDRGQLRRSRGPNLDQRRHHRRPDPGRGRLRRRARRGGPAPAAPGGRSAGGRPAVRPAHPGPAGLPAGPPEQHAADL